MALTSLVAAMIAYIVLTLEITGCTSSPITQATGSIEEPTCHQDFNYQPLISQCQDSSEDLTIRYSYDSSSSTCLLTPTCSLGFNETHATKEECESACIQAQDMTTSQVCPIPELSNGKTHTISDCREDCFVYYSCDHGYELYPKDNRAKKFQCSNGIWEEHTVNCAKVEVIMKVDGARAEVYSTNKTVAVDGKKEISLSCEVAGDVSEDTYEIMWTYKSHDREVEEIGNTSVIVLPSANKTHEGAYTCFVSGLVNQQIQTLLTVIMPSPAGPPEISHTLVVADGYRLIGQCICIGSNIQSWWTVNDEVHSNDLLAQDPHRSFNVLDLSIMAGEYKVSCKCENEHGLVESETVLKDIPNVQTERRRRNIPEITEAKMQKLCEMNDKTAIVTGEVLRQTRSTVHLKVDDVVRIHDARIEDNAILRIQSNQKLVKHQKYALKIERRNSEHTLVDVLPFTSGIDKVIASYCQ